MALACLAAAVVVSCSSERSPDAARSAASTTAPPTTAPPTTAPPTTAPPADGAPSTAVEANCSTAGEPQRSVVQYRDEPGSDPDLTTLEVIRPSLPEECGPVPVMVWVHGGGWRTGDRRNGLDDKIELFTSQGWALVSVNYRLSPAVRYPVHNDDVAAAVGWVFDGAAGIGLDPDRVSIMGHSAGAGIVAGVTVDPRHLDLVGHHPSQLRCAVLLDTEGYDVAAKAATGNRLYLDAFGDDPATWRQASPILQIDPATEGPRSMVVTRGGQRRTAGSAAFVDALREAGVEARLLDVSPLSHAEVNQAVGADGDDTVTPALVEFLADC